MATGYGISNKGKPNGAGEEMQDIDWDSIPPEKRGMQMGQPQPKMKADAILIDPDPFAESQIVYDESKQDFYDDDCQLPLHERKRVPDALLNNDGEVQGHIGYSDSQVKTTKKVADPNNGTKTKKVPYPKRK